MIGRGRKTAATLLFIGMVVSACVAPGSVPTVYTGLFLRVTTSFSVPPLRARAFFQDGRQVASVDIYRPHCEFELNTVKSYAQPVAVDRFAIVRHQQRVVADEQSGVPAGPMSAFRCDLDHYYESVLQLRADTQQDVRRLICRDWRMSCDLGRYLALDEILAVLGPTFALD